MLGSGSQDGTIKLWKLKSSCWTVENVATLNNRSAVQCLAAFNSSDSQILVSGIRDIRLWSLNTKEMIETLAGHADWFKSIIFLDEGTLESCGKNGKIKLWPLRRRKSIACSY